MDIRVPLDDEVKIYDSQGILQLKASVVILDILLAEAQRPYLDSGDEEAIRSGAWIEDYVFLIEKRYGWRPTPTAAFFIAQKCSAYLNELKKSCDPMPTSCVSTELTLSDSIP